MGESCHAPILERCALCPARSRLTLALAANAYETDTPFEDWLDWAAWVRYNERIRSRRHTEED